MDRGAWRATVHGVSKSQDTTERLHFHFQFFFTNIRHSQGGQMKTQGGEAGTPQAFRLQRNFCYVTVSANIHHINVHTLKKNSRQRLPSRKFWQ